MASALCLHRETSRVSLADLLANVPPPNTDTHYPIAHGTLYRAVVNSLGFHGQEIASEQHAITPDGSRYFGLLSLAQGAEDYCTTIGLRNSHDKRFPASLCVGSRVFVCDNLAFSAEVVISRRHTRRIMDDLPMLVSNAVGRLGSAIEKQHEQVTAYKQIGLTNDRARSLLMESMKLGVLNCTQLPAALAAWESPAYEQFKDPTIWRLFNAITEVGKKWAAPDVVARTNKLHGLCNLEANFAV